MYLKTLVSSSSSARFDMEFHVISRRDRHRDKVILLCKLNRNIQYCFYLL
ncbi:hypothetical protein A1OE_860 [Candidatus Endolissoclinum faulkneri L2]|uniref:Uncharacterized protein n=1 Tax=Candidatus Endolissoclinum faulkneri L2 TaxID=1193729 RepID=K7YR87_9PROT|nr:hypothetical protein A1OE_860 [Candidatus Endolissoclinum faulkneri L2]